MKLKPVGLVVVATATAMSAAIAVPMLSSAQAPTGQTITFQEPAARVAIDDIAPKSKSGRLFSLGDRAVTQGALFDAGKKRVGTIATTCTGAGPTKPIFAATLLCTATYQVADGQIVASGVFKLDGSGTLPIVGGSGAYAGAHGTVTSAKPAKGYESADVITIAG